MVTFKFKPTKNDYLKAFRTFYMSNWFIWAGLMVFMLFSFLCFISSFLFNASGLVYGRGYLLFISLALLTFFVFLFFINPLKAANKVEMDERLGSPVQGQADEEQISFKTQFLETKLDWGSYHKVLESKDQFLLIHSANKNMFQIIPKRAFASVDDERAFRDLLKVKIPEKQRGSFEVKNSTVIIIIFISLAFCLSICSVAVLTLLIRTMY